MSKQIYQQRTLEAQIVKIRLQHTATDDQLSPMLERLDELINKSQLYSYSRPRLGKNPKFVGQQATTIYMEMDADALLKMFEFLTLSTAWDSNHGIHPKDI